MARLLMHPTPYEGFEFSRNIIQTPAAPDRHSAHSAEYPMREFGARVYLVGSDYICPYASNPIMSHCILDRPGGAKLAERCVRLDANERYQACADACIDAQATLIASLTTCEAEVSGMGTRTASGHITSAPHLQRIDKRADHSCLNRGQAIYEWRMRSEQLAAAATGSTGG